MSPTVFRERGYRFFFFSREESRPHVHVYSGDGEAKFWLQPEVSLARNYKFSAQQIREIQAIIEDRRHVIQAAWNQHFGR